MKKFLTATYNMRVLLVAALFATAYGAGELCSDTDGDASGTTTAVVCDAGTYYDISGGDADISASGDAGQTECCTACPTGMATCSDATTALTCDAGYGFIDPECVACAGTEFSIGGNNGCADWTQLSAACTGANFYTAGSSSADDATCTACANAGIATCTTAAADGATACAVGYGLNAGSCTACDGTTQFSAAADTNDCVDMTPACTGATYESVPLTTDVDRTCAACNDTNGNIATCNGADVDDALSCTAGNGFAAGACTACTGSTFSLGSADCAAYATPTCATDNSEYLMAGTPSNDAACTACTTVTGFATCTDATTAVTCAAGYEFDSGACTECAPGMFVATAGVAACADWTAQCPDGTVPLPVGTTTADRVGTCTACATADAATCDASDVALTCAVGFFLDGAACTACTAADDSDNVVPTGWVVPANATGDAGTWDCSEADASGWSAYTCDTGFTASDPAATCEADVAVTTTAAPSSTSADGSDTSPAFIVGTAIAGIALLL